MTVIPLPPQSVPCLSVTVIIDDRETFADLVRALYEFGSVAVIIDDRDTFAALVRALFECDGNYL